MADKHGIYHLRLTADQRTAENWTVFQNQTEHRLAGIECGDICLDELLTNTGTGEEPDNPGANQATWIAAAPEGQVRTAADFTAAQKTYRTWVRANTKAHHQITLGLPEELQEAAVQRQKARDLWAYLADRFAGTNLTSVALLSQQLFTMTMDDYSNFSEFLTAFNKTKSDIAKADGVKDSGSSVHRCAREEPME